MSAAADRARRSEAPPTHHVRHVFWKYPILALVAAAVIVVVAATAGSPNWPRETIAAACRKDPGGAVLAITEQLDGTSSSWSNVGEYGVTAPDKTFVMGPVADYAPLLGANVSRALATYQRAGARQQRAWSSAYDTALGTISAPMTGAAVPGSMSGSPSPDPMRIPMLRGDFGPVPTIVAADLKLAQAGYLEQYLVGLDPGHSLHLPTIWLYDDSITLNTAVANGLTDDQWGMVKERGFAVGPWYLILPAVFHVEAPGGSTGTGFVLWNLAAALFFILVVPLVPGLRSLPARLRLHRFIYRYPRPGDPLPADARTQPPLEEAR